MGDRSLSRTNLPTRKNWARKVAILMCKLKLTLDSLFKSNAVFGNILPHRQTNTPNGIKYNALVLGGLHTLLSVAK